MKENNEVKEIIINTTMELINECNGDVGKITMRKIAQKADIGLGLINYYFGNKNQLITICVQRHVPVICESFVYSISGLLQVRGIYTISEISLVCHWVNSYTNTNPREMGKATVYINKEGFDTFIPNEVKRNSIKLCTSAANLDEEY